MLSYRHLFHAGNFADVFKHALLAQLVLLLERKDKPFLYLDTHAGTGRYDLTHPWAQKKREYRDGIERLWQRDDDPRTMRAYLAAVREENRDGRLRFYPGSPLLTRRLLRPGDRMVLAELNKSDCAELATLFARDRQVQVLHMDGYQALKAHLPPKERRGLVLIDSSFDRAHELARIVAALEEVHRRFATGVCAVWYPLLEPPAIRRFERDVAQTGLRKILKAELTVRADLRQERMRGCGMLVVNAPFGLETIAPPMLEWLHGALAQDGGGGWRVEWLVAE